MDEITKAFTGRIHKYLAMIEAGNRELDSAVSSNGALEKVRHAAQQALREIHDFVSGDSAVPQQPRPHAAERDAEAAHTQQPI